MQKNKHKERPSWVFQMW